MELKDFLKSKNVRHNLQVITVKQIVDWFENWEKTELKEKLEIAYNKGIDSAIRMITENRNNYVLFNIFEGDKVIWNGDIATVIQIRKDNYVLIEVEYGEYYKPRLVLINELKPI